MLRRFGIAALCACLMASVPAAVSPANAAVHVYLSLGAGYGPPVGFRNCRFYRYYGLPPRTCYLSYSGPVYYGGRWYRGPVYYRWYSGRPMFWIHGGWRDWDGWRHRSWRAWHDRDLHHH